jgi:hypothetical protein
VLITPAPPIGWFSEVAPLSPATRYRRMARTDRRQDGVAERRHQEDVRRHRRAVAERVSLQGTSTEQRETEQEGRRCRLKKRQHGRRSTTLKNTRVRFSLTLGSPSLRPHATTARNGYFPPPVGVPPTTRPRRLRRPLRPRPPPFLLVLEAPPAAAVLLLGDESSPAQRTTQASIVCRCRALQVPNIRIAAHQLPRSSRKVS